MLFIIMWLCFLAALGCAVTGARADRTDTAAIAVAGCFLLLGAGACFWYAAVHSGGL